MIIGSQRRKVERISAMATKKKSEMVRRGIEIHRWNQNAFGRLDALAWIFAAGATWSVISSSRREEGRLRRALLGLTNAALITSRFLGHSGPAEAAVGE